MKKFLSLLLAVVLLVGITACGQAQTSTQAPAAPAASGNFNKTGYPITNEPTTITALIHGRINYATNYPQPRILWEEIEKLTNVHLDVVVLPDSEQLPLFMAAGDWPDFFHDNLQDIYITDYGILGKQLVDYNTILDLMPHLAASFEEFPDTRKAQTYSNGAIYQTVNYGDTITSANSRSHYRSDILAEFDLPVPKTTDEFFETCVKLLEYRGEPPFAPGWDKDYWYSLFGDGVYFGYSSNLNIGFDDEYNDGTVTFSRTTEQARHYMEYMNKLYTNGLIHPEFVMLEKEDAALIGMAQDSKTVFINHAIASVNLDAFPSGKFDIGVLAPLTSPYSDTQCIQTGVAPWGLSRGKAINAASKNIDIVARVLDIAYAKTEVAPGTGLYGTAFTWGPEGITWEFTNAEKTTHKQNVPEGMTYTEFAYGFQVYDGHGLDLGLKYSIVMDGSNSEARQIGYRDHNHPYARAWMFPPVKFLDDERSTVDNYITELRTYANDMHDRFIMGVADIEKEWDTYVSTFDKMELQEIMKIYQAAYDRWRNL